jgi:hypothetical protein
MSELRGTAEKQADKLIKKGLAGWWARADDAQKFGVVGLSVAAAIGPLGQGLAGGFGILFSEAALPSSKQLAAVAWLFVITLPVAAWILVVVLGFGKMPGGGLLALAAGAAVLAGWVMQSPSIPTKLGDLYCYASVNSSGAYYEQTCRDFDAAGFVSETYDKVSPSGSLDVFGWAVAYTADARGLLMVVASIIAALSVSTLIRREM